MKKRYLYLLVMLALVAGCVEKGTDEANEPKEQTEEPVDDPKDDPDDPTGQGGKALGVADDDTSVTFKQRTEAYLLSIGVSRTDIDDFRSLMLE